MRRADSTSSDAGERQPSWEGYLKVWWGLRLGLRMLWLPIVLRLYSLPTLLQRLAPPQLRRETVDWKKAERVAVAVRRFSGCRLFRPPVFPRACLRESLALYYLLNQMGFPAEIHFGVSRRGRELVGHSWVTLEGKSVLPSSENSAFTAVYSHSPAYAR